MSFAELTADALTTHAEWFADDIEYRPDSKSAFSTIEAIPYPEFTRNKRTNSGWISATSREFMIQIEDLQLPQLNGQIRFEDRIYVIDKVTRSRSGRWQVTGDRETATEVSRPGYRGPRS